MQQPDLVQLENALAVAGREALAEGARARASYRARMAFRPTPSGLLAGVAVGHLAERTALATGGAGRAHLHVRWARLAALVRALLHEPVDGTAVREATRLRACPSLLWDGDVALWLRGARSVEEVPLAHTARAPIDAALGAVIEATHAGWRPWTAVREAVMASAGGDETGADDLILLLLDGGLLVDDLTPPLVGPPPLEALIAALERAARRGAPLREVIAGLHEVRSFFGRAPAAADPTLADVARAARGRLAALPGHGPDEVDAVDAVLELSPREAKLSRAAVERAARVAPLVYRLAEALLPRWERATGPTLEGAVASLLEHHGPGAYPVDALVHGRYGAVLGEPHPTALGEDLPAPPSESPVIGPRPTAPAALLRLLVERLVASGARAPIDLSARELEAALPEVALPPTLELVLSPAREPPDAAPGTDWLLGLHGPAGATWGRFAHALGDALGGAFSELVATERTALPAGALALDVDFTPSAAVADVATHPPVREATLALSRWPVGEVVTPAELELVLTPLLAGAGVDGAPEGLGLQHTPSGRPVVPLPASRLRSTTVEEEGLYRLMVGFSLQRAVAPWALHLGALAGLPRLPRFAVEGFVVAPASFALPAELLHACRQGARPGTEALRRWRGANEVPRRVQIGYEDLLLPIDQDEEAEAVAQLARLADRPGPPPRAWEIWPPLDRLADEDGRRVEAVVGAVAGRSVEIAEWPVPAVEPRPDPAWRTFFVGVAPDRADRVLVEALAPAVASALAAGEIDGWFFLRYLDEARGHHLRLRVHRAADVDGRRRRPERAWAAFADRLDRALVPWRAESVVWTVESGDYRPERLRYGGARAMPIVEAAFQADSELVVGLLALEVELRPDGVELLVRQADALAAGLGLDLDDRQELARRLRGTDDARTHQRGREDPWADLYRQRQARLTEALAVDRGRPGPRDDGATPLLRTYARRLRPLGRRLGDEARAVALPSLLHLAAVRLVGPVAEHEVLGRYLWQRALEGVRARQRRR